MVLALQCALLRAAEPFVTFTAEADALPIHGAVISFSDSENEGVKMAIENLKADMQRVDSTQNKKSTFATNKNNYDSRDENNDYYLTIRKNNKKGNHFNNNMIIEENEQNNDIVKTSNRSKEEDNIFISKRRKQRLDSINNDGENVCCTTGCIIF